MSQANTNTQLQAFVNPEFGEIRAVIIDGEPWLVGKDVAKALGYKEPSKAVREKVDSEDRGMSKIDTPSGTQDMTVINESGLYALILSSKLPGAKKFKRWVTSEVLPSIRKTGSYGAKTVDQDVIKALTSASPEQMPAVLDYLRACGHPVGTYEEIYGRLIQTDKKPVSRAGTKADAIVQAFADEIFPQSQWGLFPFGALYDLYLTWFDKNQIHGKPLGKKTFINAIVSLADAGSIPGWRCPGKKCSVRPKHLMDAPEPVIAYALNPKHLVRRQTYTGLLRV